jgi:hypothetical protein
MPAVGGHMQRALRGNLCLPRCYCLGVGVASFPVHAPDAYGAIEKIRFIGRQLVAGLD